MTMSIAEISVIIENSTSLSEAYAKIEEIEGKRFPKINDPNLLDLYLSFIDNYTNVPCKVEGDGNRFFVVSGADTVAICYSNTTADLIALLLNLLPKTVARSMISVNKEADNDSVG